VTNAFIGVHGRNAVEWDGLDFAVLAESSAQVVKMMSHTAPHVFERIAKTLHPYIITRLYDDRFGVGHIVSPSDFVARMVPIIDTLRPWCDNFEVHNEPSHPAGYEGWGITETHAHSFNTWFMETLGRLRRACPWAIFGFPGLAVPHNDMAWLEICRPSIDRADWLGSHLYWQNPTTGHSNHLSPAWGLRCEQYHDRHPHKLIQITEAGNSNHQTGGLPHDEQVIAWELVNHAQACRGLEYVGSVAYFILSSPDPMWSKFAWRTEGGEVKPLVSRLGGFIRGHS
jgi:hypothetical protein